MGLGVDGYKVWKPPLGWCKRDIPTSKRELYTEAVMPKPLACNCILESYNEPI